MPYKTIVELPDNIKRLPEHTRKLYLEVFNLVLGEGNDKKVAWSIALRTMLAPSSIREEIKCLIAH